MTPKIIHWDSAWGPMNEENMSRRLSAEGYAVSKYHYPAGTYFASHAHSRHKKDTVLRGRLKIEWEEGAAILEPGDMIEIPAGVHHSAEVVGREAVVSLDATKE